MKLTILLSRVLFATLLIVSTLLCNTGCATKPKSIVVAFPGYVELAQQTTATAIMDFGQGPENKDIKLDRRYYCYDKDTQEDVLATKKGK